MNRIGIVGPLSEIERLAKEYIEEVVKDDPLVSWRITDFLLWIKRRQNEQRKRNPVNVIHMNQQR